MRPRVFVSSTYYDLKYARERLERFIRGYNFEPVLSESGHVTFEHGKARDESCYKEVGLCHIMILLIGGRYGNSISGDDITERETYDKEYVSITRREFETALERNIPVFVFVDKNVHADYETYKKNQKKIEEENDYVIDFAHVDSINVFRFISHIDINKTKAIKTFDGVEEIEIYLSEQIAGWLHLYLEQLQKEQREKEVLNAVSELKNISKRMDEMLSAIGEKIIGEKNYKKIIDGQNEKIIAFFAEQFQHNLEFKYRLSGDEDKLKGLANKILEVCNETLFNLTSLKSDHPLTFHGMIYREVNKFTKKLLGINSLLAISRIDGYDIVRSYNDSIYPIVSENNRLKQLFEKKLSYAIFLSISELPF
jgi:hypothetical protein